MTDSLAIVLYSRKKEEQVFLLWRIFAPRGHLFSWFEKCTFFGSYIDFLPAFQIPLGLTRENLIVFHGKDWVNYCGMSNFCKQDVHKKLSILLANRYDVVCTYLNDVIAMILSYRFLEKQTRITLTIGN